MGAISTPASWVPGTVGALEACVECKLIDAPDLGYFTSTIPPQGQILLRGPCVTSGYLNREKETEELFDKDGWLRTGDIGEFDSYGRLRIIDRVKNLVKTLNGEYIALEKVLPSARLTPSNPCPFSAFVPLVFSSPPPPFFPFRPPVRGLTVA
jgi:long-chain acyl-CoA synthetase